MRKGFLASRGCRHVSAGQLCDVLRHFCDLFLAGYAAAAGGGGDRARWPLATMPYFALSRIPRTRSRPRSHQETGVGEQRRTPQRKKPSRR
jgi:hypothetical protein